MKLLAWMLVGACLAALLWLVVVPWDLSTVDATGRVIPGRGQAANPEMTGVYLAVLAAGVLMALRGGGRARSAVGLTAGGMAMYVLLFTWRTAVARVVGANLFIVPLVILVLPGAIVATLLVAAITRYRRRHRPATGPRPHLPRAQ